MPQDTPQQAIIRGALQRFPQNIGGLSDMTLTLSPVEITAIREVLMDSIRVPGEPTPGDAPVAPIKRTSAKKSKKSAKPAPKKTPKPKKKTGKRR